jgi:hypothetical protein
MNVVLEKEQINSVPALSATIPALYSAPVFGELVQQTEAALRVEAEARQKQQQEQVGSKRREVYGLD